MKRFKHIYALVFAAFAISVTGCNPEIEPQAPKSVEFTVRYSDVAYNYAVINVKHNGPEDITWYGFVTENIKENDFKLYYSKYQELIKSGKTASFASDTSGFKNYSSFYRAYVNEYGTSPSARKKP